MVAGVRIAGRGARRGIVAIAFLVAFSALVGPRVTGGIPVAPASLAALVQPPHAPVFTAKTPPVERDLDGTARSAEAVEQHAKSDAESAPPPPPPPANHQPLRRAVLDADFPDPSVLWVGDHYIAVATNSGGRNVQITGSLNLADWSALVDAAPFLPVWSRPGVTWAPSVAPIAGRWVMYVSLPGAASGEQCVDRLVSPTPDGPYVPVDFFPLLCNPVGGNGVIDPSPLVTADGHVFLYWKNTGGHGTQIYVNELTPDGLHVAGAPVPLLNATARWESNGVENPDMVFAGGRYWLFYSANWWIDDRYTMGYAMCDGPVGPCHKVTVDGPWLSSRDAVAGPGGGSLFTDLGGQWWLAYHSWGHAIGYRAGGTRELHVEPVSFDGGAPSLVDRAPIGKFEDVRRSPGGVTAAGWALDPDTGAPIAVRLSVGGHDLGASPSAVTRPDVAAAFPTSGARHGFSALLPLAPGLHDVCAYALDDVGGTGAMLGCLPVSVADQPIGAVDGLAPTNGGFTVSGWAIDPDVAGAVQVDVYLDGTRLASTTADQPRADLAAAYPDYGPAHGWQLAVPAPPGEHEVCVYALDDRDEPSTRLACTTLAPGPAGPTG
jgi:hypothetical protein